MTTSALHDIANVSALKTAWKSVSKNKLNQPGANRAGPDGRSLISFSNQLDAELVSLAAGLREGSFKFSPLDPFFLPKPNGKFRVICVPIVADRVVQRAVLEAIGRRQEWMKNAVSYGFVSDGGVERAARKAIEYRIKKPWVFKTDITKFFDHVDRQKLKAKVVRQVKQKSLHRLLFDAIDCEIKPRLASHTKRIKQLDIQPGRGVRQGMPLSPFFANLFLADFDKACIQQGLSALRYADDLIFFASSKTEAEALQAFCASQLAAIKLHIPSLDEGGKTQICAPTEAVEFLGVELTPVSSGGYQVQVGKRQRDVIKDNLYSLSSLQELRQRGLDMSKFGNSIAARVAAYSSAYAFCANHGQLDANLRDWSRETLKRIAFALGIDLTTLSDDGRWFLGLSD